jgi:hypothetical protein
MRKILQEDVDSIEDPSLKAWAAYLMKKGREIPENDAERVRIAQQEMDDEIFKVTAQILDLKNE